MARVILLCGKLCSGKTTYAKDWCRRHKAVLLSMDALMLALFGQHCGDMHDEYAARTRRYLFAESLQILESGVDVVLDWGFWTKEDRKNAREFYACRNIPCEFHYLDVSEEKRFSQIQKRNREVADGKLAAYFVDEPLLAKLKSRFEIPSREEMDVWITSE